MADTLKIIVLEGDETGQELLEQSVRVLDPELLGVPLELFEQMDLEPELIRGVASHADFLGVSRDSDMEKTLYAVDELCGFIVACAYVRPEGIHGMTPKSVKKKLKTASFAAAVNRDEVRAGAEELGVDFDEHVAFVIAALQPHADELGLSGSPS